MGQLVDVLRGNSTRSSGYINAVHRGGPPPHLVIRYANRDWKRVLLSEVEANIRPNAGGEILESLFEPAGATPKANEDFGSADDDISDTELLRACVQWQQCSTACNDLHAMSMVDSVLCQRSVAQPALVPPGSEAATATM